MKRFLFLLLGLLMLSGCGSALDEDVIRQTGYDEGYLAGYADATSGKAYSGALAMDTSAVAMPAAEPVKEPAREAASTPEPTSPPRGITLVRCEGAEKPSFAPGEIVTTSMAEAVMYTGQIFWADGCMFSATYNGNDITLYFSIEEATKEMKPALANGAVPDWWTDARNTFLDWNAEAMSLYEHYDEPINLTSVFCDTYIRADVSVPYLVVKNGIVTYDVTSATTELEQPPVAAAPEQELSGAGGADEQAEITAGMRNAVRRAHEYLGVAAFSCSGMAEQLEYEGFTVDEAAYGAENCGADWNEQAAKKGASYLDIMAFSRTGLIEQLMYDGFTREQAEYGASQNGL